jgi:hypothetical protein
MARVGSGWKAGAPANRIFGNCAGSVARCRLTLEESVSTVSLRLTVLLSVGLTPGASSVRSSAIGPITAATKAPLPSRLTSKASMSGGASPASSTHLGTGWSLRWQRCPRRAARLPSRRSVLALRRLRPEALVVRGLHGGTDGESGRSGGREMQFVTHLCPQLWTVRMVPRPQATSSAPRRRTTPLLIVPSRGGLSTAPTRSRGLRRNYAELSQSPLSATSQRHRSTF